MHPPTLTLLFHHLSPQASSFGAAVPKPGPKAAGSKPSSTVAGARSAPLLPQGLVPPGALLPGSGPAAVALPALSGSKGETKTSGAAPVSVEGE